MLNPDDLKTYTAEQVASLSDIDLNAVEREGARRQDAAEKKRKRAMKLIAEASKEMQEGEVILLATMRQRAENAKLYDLSA